MNMNRPAVHVRVSVGEDVLTAWGGSSPHRPPPSLSLHQDSDSVSRVWYSRHSGETVGGWCVCVCVCVGGGG